MSPSPSPRTRTEGSDPGGQIPLHTSPAHPLAQGRHTGVVCSWLSCSLVEWKLSGLDSVRKPERGRGRDVTTCQEKRAQDIVKSHCYQGALLLYGLNTSPNSCKGQVTQVPLGFAAGRLQTFFSTGDPGSEPPPPISPRLGLSYLQSLSLYLQGTEVLTDLPRCETSQPPSRTGHGTFYSRHQPLQDCPRFQG